MSATTDMREVLIAAARFAVKDYPAARGPHGEHELINGRARAFLFHFLGHLSVADPDLNSELKRLLDVRAGADVDEHTGVAK